MSTEAVDRSSILNINVGILGHVDAGKTSLVRSLSTSLSTAALDKNPQSQQRGITLDLGFSSFTLPMPAHLATDPNISQYEHIQFTLVDCPGHASLIRTIIGGAQIIDMILLVVDANKGIQTQTAECIVIGEITTDNMIIVLNKVDTIPEADREAKIERVSNRIRKVFASTKFAGVPIVATAASVGGEKTIGAGAQTQKSAALPPSEGIEDLLNLIKQKVVIPARNYNAPFYYAIDHCFSIKGHGTVLTGTVLSGSVSTNSIIEIPHLQITRKVKSLQMFRKPVKSARQGDRVGICVTNLDASLIERSVACAPSTVPLLQSVLCLVKKVRFFRHACKSLSKFHVSIGHETVVATAVFFGSSQLAQYVNAIGKDPTADLSTITNSNNTVKQSALNATYHKSFPAVDFDFYDPDYSTTAVSKPESAKQPSQHQQQHQHQHHGYEYQEEMLSAEGLAYNTEPLQWALLQFQHSVYCPIGSLIIGSRLDTDTSDHPGSNNNNNSNSGGSSTGKEKEGGVPSAAQQCRLAFFGPVKASLGGVADLPRTGVYSWKCKECEVFLLTDTTTSNTTTATPKSNNNKATHHSANSNSTTVTQKTATNKDSLVHEIVVWKLITGGGAVTPFLGMQVETLDKKITGTIVSSYGADGKVRVKFSTGVRGLTVGSKLLFRYKKYLFDKSKKMDQSGLDQLRAEEAVLRMDSEDNNSINNSAVGGGDDDNGRTNMEEGGILLETATEAVRIEDSLLQSHGDASSRSAEVSTVMRDTSVGVTSPLPPPLLPKLSPEETMATPTIISSAPAPTLTLTPSPIVRTTFTPLSTLLSQIAVTNPSNDNNNTTSFANTSIPSTQTTSNTTTATSSDIHYPIGTSAETHLMREGTIESVKTEDTSEIVTVKGAFRMEENIRLHIGAVAVSSISNNNPADVGSLVGPFGKMGKCKVKFEVGQAGSVGDTISIFTLK